MSTWELTFYETANGRSPVRDYLDGLSAEEAARVVADLGLLAAFGVELGMPHVRQLRGRLWELRTVGKVQHRVIYVAISGHRLVLLHAFTKKTQTTPSREIDLAERRFADFQSREGR